jgi:hypothetical protein
MSVDSEERGMFAAVLVAIRILWRGKSLPSPNIWW